ncbi:MAG: GNAT family N-acetyltransferase [Myxococcales bacterium]|nr:GNAT family N-acetyltransferase [Myxococcales bacterium]
MDRSLARRLERTEGAVSTSFTEVNERLRPALGAAWHDFDGTYAIFDGTASPLTQTFGLGLFGAATPDALAAIERFFFDRGADVMHEVSPLAGVATYALLAERRYTPHELSTVLVQGLETAPEVADVAGLQVRVIEPADHAVWIETSVAGWANDPTYASSMREMATAAAANRAMLHFVVERDGVPIATASLGVHDGVALLAGASTIPAGRGLGAQGLLLSARLGEARRRGCELAMMVADPGSRSQRNAERRGFRVAYTRTKWRLART